MGARRLLRVLSASYFICTVWQPLQPKPVWVAMSNGLRPMAVAMWGTTCSAMNFEISGLSANEVSLPSLKVSLGK